MQPISCQFGEHHTSFYFQKVSNSAASHSSRIKAWMRGVFTLAQHCILQDDIHKNILISRPSWNKRSLSGRPSCHCRELGERSVCRFSHQISSRDEAFNSQHPWSPPLNKRLIVNPEVVCQCILKNVCITSEFKFMYQYQPHVLQ